MNFALARYCGIRSFAYLATPAKPEPAGLLQALPYRYGESSGCRLARIGSAI
jgi:hypothetical protein